MAVAFGVGPLDVDDGDVRVQRRDGDDQAAGVGVGDGPVAGVGLGQVVDAGRVHRHERHAGGPRRQAGDHGEMRVLLPFERPGLQRGADDAQRADAGVAGIGEDDLAGAAGGDHLVVDQVGRGAGQHKLAPTLTDDLVPGGERDQVGEAGGVDQVAIVDVSRRRRHGGK